METRTPSFWRTLNPGERLRRAAVGGLRAASAVASLPEAAGVACRRGCRAGRVTPFRTGSNPVQTERPRGPAPLPPDPRSLVRGAERRATRAPRLPAGGRLSLHPWRTAWRPHSRRCPSRTGSQDPERQKAFVPRRSTRKERHAGAAGSASDAPRRCDQEPASRRSRRLHKERKHLRRRAVPVTKLLYYSRALETTAAMQHPASDKGCAWMRLSRSRRGLSRRCPAGPRSTSRTCRPRRGTCRRRPAAPCGG